MSKKFVLGTPPQATDIEAQFIKAFEQNGYIWWHWLPGLWLLVTPDSETAFTIRETLRRSPLFGDKHELLVIEVKNPPGQWAGAAHPRGDAKMADWLLSVWDKA